MMKRLWREDEGVLTFEWVLLTTVLVIGIVGGLSGVRDAINHELASLVGAMVSLDQSYSISQPINVAVIVDGSCAAGGVSSKFTDSSTWSLHRTNGTTTQTISASTVACTP